MEIPKFPKELDPQKCRDFFPWTVEAKNNYMRERDDRRVRHILRILTDDKTAKDKMIKLFDDTDLFEEMDKVYAKYKHTTHMLDLPESESSQDLDVFDNFYIEM